MELKNALTICLLCFFSATLVMLIARSLDNQAASRLEPQLTQIAEELRAFRAQGGVVPSASDTQSAASLEDGLVVYYFHGDIRCPTCRAIESQTREVVEKDFADQLSSGQITWKILNYDKPAAAELASKFEIQMANVVLARYQDGQVNDWKRLDQVWALYGDPTEFAAFVRDEITRMLGESATSGEARELTGPLDVPLPDGSSEPSEVDLPLPD